MPTADEELAQINEKLGKIQSSQYKKYADKIKTFLVNKSDSGTQKNLDNKPKNLTLKGGKGGKKVAIKSVQPEVGPVGDTSSNEDGDGPKPVRIATTLAQGDCFFSAIFRALKERDLLEGVGTCLGIDVSDETKFIISYRNKHRAMLYPSLLGIYFYQDQIYHYYYLSLFKLIYFVVYNQFYL